MSYSITIGGHGPSAATVQRVFESAVRELRAESAEGMSVSGFAAGTAGDGSSFSFQADDVGADEPEEGEPG